MADHPVKKTVESVGKTLGKSVEVVGETVGKVLTATPRVVVGGIRDLFGRTRPVGAPPGALSIDEALPEPRIHILAQGPDGVVDEDVDDLDDLLDRIGSLRLSWIDVQGLGDQAVLEEIAQRFHIHRLALSDIVHSPQRPKLEIYESHDLIILRMLSLNDAREMELEQLSVLVGEGFVLTFQERYGDILDPVRARFRDGSGPIGELGSDYLAYAIIDTVVDGYFPVLEAFADRLEGLEDQVLATPRPHVLADVQKTKRTLIMLRRSVWPLREVLNAMLRDSHTRSSEATRPYLRDTYDHCIQVNEVTESYREVASELTNTYMSVVANRTNDVMKVLTIMASIFIPLTFVAGIYGMNFENMPELHQRWGYPAVLAAMVFMGLGMVIYFRRKGWLGDDEDDP